MGDNRRVIEFKAGPAFRDPPRRKRKRAPKPETSESRDPNAKKTDRLYEIEYHHVSAENVITVRYRIRVPKQGAENNVYEVGNAQMYFGMVQAEGQRGKWSHPGFGWLPVEGSFVREIVEEPKKPTPIKEHKDEKTDDK